HFASRDGRDSPQDRYVLSGRSIIWLDDRRRKCGPAAARAYQAGRLHDRNHAPSQTGAGWVGGFRVLHAFAAQRRSEEWGSGGEGRNEEGGRSGRGFRDGSGDSFL